MEISSKEGDDESQVDLVAATIWMEPWKWQKAPTFWPLTACCSNQETFLGVKSQKSAPFKRRPRISIHSSTSKKWMTKPQKKNSLGESPSESFYLKALTTFAWSQNEFRKPIIFKRFLHSQKNADWVKALSESFNEGLTICALSQN